MIVFPKAKINLGLRITDRREDGYHNIETVFYPVSLCDALEFVVPGEPSDRDTLFVTGIAVGGNPDENIVMKSIRKMRERYLFPRLKIHLHKAIPHGAGLGGGSSDAAYILKAVNRYFCLLIGEDDLKSLSLDIGSDCPFFLDGNPSFASGRGEKLEPIRSVLSGYYLLLVNPGVGINTREAYQNCTPHQPETSLRSLVDHNISEWKSLIVNDFEDFAFKKHPVIGEIKDDLYSSGALYSSMSGSGSSVYGIFSQKPDTLPGRVNKMIIYEGVL